VAELSDKDMFAYYKRIAPVEDVKFQLRLTSLTADIRAGYEALLEALTDNAGKATADTKREYLRLQALWRESKRADDPRVPQISGFGLSGSLRVAAAKEKPYRPYTAA
jgi:hypothetical protein